MTALGNFRNAITWPMPESQTSEPPKAGQKIKQCQALWCVPREPETRNPEKTMKWRESDSKSDFSGQPRSDKKVSQKWLKNGPKVTEPNLRFSCGFLRKSSVFCENLRFSAAPCALHMLEIPGEGVNLRKSAVFSENLRFRLSLPP